MSTQETRLIPPCWKAKLRQAERHITTDTPALTIEQRETLESNAMDWAYCAVGETLFGVPGSMDHAGPDAMPDNRHIEQSVFMCIPAAVSRGHDFTAAVNEQLWTEATNKLTEIKELITPQKRKEIMALLESINPQFES